MGKDAKGSRRNAGSFLKAGKKSMRMVFRTIISLVVVSVVLTSMTFSWFSVKTTYLDSEIFSLDCGKGLRVNDSGTSQLQFQQVDKYLIPASSVDGRNLFFPTDGSDFSAVTENMTFRSANAGDKNQNYIQIDFSLTAQQNHTALYINEEKTSIKVRDTRSDNDDAWSIPQAAAIRSALWASTAENGVPNTPIVFNPTISTVRTAAVADVDRSTGAFISSGRQVAHAFSEYAFGGTPVATLSKGIATKFSYIIWLEGTDPKCTNKILEKNIQVNLAFTTSWDKTQTIRFRDDTQDNWLTNLINDTSNKYSLSLRYDEVDDQGHATGNSTEFNMYKYSDDIDNMWSCNIPGDMTKNISFILRPANEGTVYQFTMSSKNDGETTYDRGANRLYVAEFGPAGGDFSKCRGYWVAVGDSDGAGHDSGGFDGDDF